MDLIEPLGPYAVPITVFIASAVTTWFLFGCLCGSQTSGKSQNGKTKAQTSNMYTSTSSDRCQAEAIPSPTTSTIPSKPAIKRVESQIYHHIYLFKPSGGQDTRALSKYLLMLNNARTSICLASMTLSGHSIYAALRDAAKRGAKVHIIVNELHDTITPEKLTRDNISFKVFRRLSDRRMTLQAGREDIFHQKFVLVDEKTLCYGSCNSSEASFKNHYENFVITNDERFVQPFRQEFWSRWKEFGW